MRDALHGHAWTFFPHALNTLRPRPAPRDEPWDTTLFDPMMGTIRLTGWLHEQRGSDALVLLVHGFGGDAESRYVIEAAHAVRRAGLSYLRFNMRGAEGSGEDIYNAGTIADLHAALSSPRFQRMRRLYVVGFSLGGHLALRYALDAARDERLRAVAAVCAPLDLSFGAHAIQRPGGRPYQWHVLRGLKAAYAITARRRPMPISAERAQQLRTVLEWDQEIVVPRFGFANRESYYEKESAGPRLRDLEVPTLFLAAERDPVVTAPQLRPWLETASDAMEVRWTAGGHVAFPELDLLGERPGPVEAQIVRWLRRMGD